MMVDYYDANFASLHVRVSNRAALHMYKDNLGFEILGVEKAYYADKEDAYKMKKYFKQAEKEKEKSKFLQLTNEVKWEEIEDAFEEVDTNGEEKIDVKEEKKEDQIKVEDIIGQSPAAEESDKKKKKKKGKKK